MIDATESAWFADRNSAEARRLIVEKYDRLAIGLARRFRGRGEPMDDLVQVARFALIKAIDRFEPEREVQFSTFATTSILGELKRHLRDKAWSVRVPRSLQERFLEVGKAVETLTHRLERSPSIAEIAAHLEVSTEDVLDAMDAGSAYRAASLDAPVGEESGAARLGDLLPAQDHLLGRSAERATVSDHLEALPDRERTVLYMRFFEDKSQREIGETLGISQMHVSRILRKTLDDLRTSLGTET